MTAMMIARKWGSSMKIYISAPFSRALASLFNDYNMLSNSMEKWDLGMHLLNSETILERVGSLLSSFRIGAVRDSMGNYIWQVPCHELSERLATLEGIAKYMDFNDAYIDSIRSD
jgi:hypothetical protein